MPITFDCPCGKSLRVADAHAGRRVKCPACGVVGLVPEPEPMFEVVEDEPPAPAPVVRAKPVKKVVEEDDEDDDTTGYTVAKKRRDEDEDEDEKPKKKKMPNFREGSGRDDDEDDDAPRRKKKKKKKRRSYSSPPPEEKSGRSLEGSIINGGVAGGILAMVIAVVWFIAGLNADRIYFYPPVLFVVGMIAFFKGLTGEE